MKNYKDGIILGVLAIISTLLFTGIPAGTNILEIITLVIFILGTLLIVFLGIIKKNSKSTVMSSIVYLIILFFIVLVVESQYKDATILAIGFIPGLVLSTTGLILSISNKNNYKTKASKILNIIGIVLSIISLLMVIPNGGFIIK